MMENGHTIKQDTQCYCVKCDDTPPTSLLNASTLLETTDHSIIIGNCR